MNAGDERKRNTLPSSAKAPSPSKKSKKGPAAQKAAGGAVVPPNQSAR